MNKAGLINKILFGSRGDAAKQADNAVLEKAFATVLKRQKENASRLPHLDDMKKRLRESRASSAGNEELLVKAIENLRRNGFRVREAAGVEEAFNAVVEEIGGERTIVKSKSNISKEMHLAGRLGAKGVEVVETDIGDRVIQFANDKPSHPTGPASHLDAAAIARIVSKGLGKDVPPEPDTIVAVLRDDIKSAIARSKIGVTGVNAITAEEGSVVIIHNEGNVAEISRLPGKHIILADTTKIYKDIPDALNMVKLQTYAATGAVTTSFINIISGPSKTADIEKKLFYGVHGPKELVVILIRRDKPPAGLEEALRCIGCGGCILECPVYLEKGSAFGAYHKQGGIGVVHSGLTEGVEEAFKNGLFACTGCGVCVKNCPAGIDTPSLIMRLREQAATAEGLKKEMKPFNLLARFVVFGANAIGAVKGIGNKRSEIAYFPGCIATINTPEVRSDIIGLMKKLGAGEPQVIEGCCGGVWESLGYEKKYAEAMDALVGRLAKAPPKEIVVSCPHCYDVMWVRNGDKFRRAGVGNVVRLTEFVKARIKGVPADKAEPGGKAAYHDSCVFGRKMGFFDEPREVLKSAAPDITLVEMDKCREGSRCCGFSIMATEPRIAGAMANKIIEAAAAVGADRIVTSGCPGCYYALKVAGGIKVEDITAVLSKRIK